MMKLKMKGLNWQYAKDLNEINEAIRAHDENWEGLTNAEQIKSITYDSNHGCYVVFWVVDIYGCYGEEFKHDKRREV